LRVKVIGKKTKKSIIKFPKHLIKSIIWIAFKKYETSHSYTCSIDFLKNYLPCLQIPGYPWNIIFFLKKAARLAGDAPQFIHPFLDKSLLFYDANFEGSAWSGRASSAYVSAHSHFVWRPISEPTVFLPLHLSNQPELANFMLRTTQTNHGGLNGMEIW
jgi:hypothetical protein